MCLVFFSFKVGGLSLGMLGWTQSSRQGLCGKRAAFCTPSSSSLWGWGLPPPHQSTSCCCSRAGRGHSQGRRPEAGQQPSLLEARPMLFSSEVRGLDSRTLRWAHSSSGGLCGRGDAFCTPSSSSGLASPSRLASSFLCLLLPSPEPLTLPRFFLDFFPPREAMSPFLPDHRSARQPEGRCREAPEAARWRLPGGASRPSPHHSLWPPDSVLRLWATTSPYLIKLPRARCPLLPNFATHLLRVGR